ncbi:hypothetical protein JCM6882_003175 [Rhodosporidiobolus microsporus]
MPSYSLSPLAYLKIVLHAAKYPASTVCGLLVGTSSSSGEATVVDAIPLLHSWADLSPAMEAGMQLADLYCRKQQWVFLGLYVANERLGDVGVPRGVGKAAEAVRKERGGEAVVLVVDNEKLASIEPALIPHRFDAPSSSWKPTTLSAANVTLSDASAPQKALEQVKARRHPSLGDFDEHLSDPTVDWLRNAGVGL